MISHAGTSKEKEENSAVPKQLCCVKSMCLATAHIKCKWEIIIYMTHILINIIISSLSFPIRNKDFCSSKSCPKLKRFLEENEKELEMCKSSKQEDQFMFIFTY